MNFLDNPQTDPPRAVVRSPEEHGPNIRGLSRMTPRKMAQSVMEVYNKLGGDAWLMKQAIADPNAFMRLITKVIPTNVNLDGMDGLSITIKDTFTETNQAGVIRDGNAENVIDFATGSKLTETVTVPDAPQPVKVASVDFI